MGKLSEMMVMLAECTTLVLYPCVLTQPHPGKVFATVAYGTLPFTI